MAPEMMKMMKYDEKVDIFSFGIVLCEVGWSKGAPRSIRGDISIFKCVLFNCRSLDEYKQIRTFYLVRLILD